MKVALYARVSRTDLILENQIRVLEEYAKRSGYDYILVLEKESSRNTRPEKEELKRKLMRKEIDGVVVSALDRWARSTAEIAQELNDFSQKGLLFVSLREGFDISTPTGRAMAQLCGVFAELERELIRERTKAGLARAKAQGKVLGRPRKTPPVNPPIPTEESPSSEKTSVYSEHNPYSAFPAGNTPFKKKLEV